jgi:putative ABC transport system permease protein
LPEGVKDEVLSELDYRMRSRIERGEPTGKVRRWYRGQVFRALVPALNARFDRENRSRPSDVRGSNGGANRGSILDSLKQDLRFAVCQLLRSPGHSLLVVITLALGIGATTSIFTLVDRALLRPLPYGNADELVVIRGDRTRAETSSPLMSGPDMLDIRREVDAFSEVALFGEPTVGPLTEVDRPIHVKTVFTSANFFRVLGVRAAVGDAYTPEMVEETTAADSTLYGSALLSYGLWQRAFGSDASVVGRTVRVWGRPLVVSGVLPEDFQFRMPRDLNPGGELEVYQTASRDFTQNPDQWWARIVARLGDGRTVATANAELENLAVRLEGHRPENADQGMRFRAESLVASVLDPIRATMQSFVVAVGLVLLIACANVANLLLVRGTTRVPELAVRSALGAARRRIVRQLLTECAVLSAVGAGVGTAVAFAMVEVVSATVPTSSSLWVEHVGLDGRVLAFTALMVVATTVLAGLAPSLRITGSGLTRRFGQRGGVQGHQRFAGALAISQVALSVGLLAGAGLMTRTMLELQRVPLGFEPSGVLTATVSQTMRPDEERKATEAALLREASALPGVQAAGIVFPLPMNGVYERTVRYSDLNRITDEAAWRDSYFRTISPGYFEAVGLAMRSGRNFDLQDENGDHPVVIVDEEAARRTWPGESPLGRRLRATNGMGAGRDSIVYEVVGVVEYAPQWDHRDVQPTLYFPRTFYRSHEVSLVLLVSGDPASLTQPLGQAVRRVEDLPIEIAPLGRYVSEALGPTRFVLTLLMVFAVVAVSLTGIGLYGVLAYGVRQRTKEIGVRMAMGAESTTILQAVMLRGGRLALVGAGLGVGGAIALGRLLRAQLYQVGAADPAALLGTALVIVTVAALASWLPARRAASVDPVEALTRE